MRNDLRQAIFSTRPSICPVEVKEWGKTVFVRQIKSCERAACRAMFENPPADSDERFVVMLTVDEAGEALFTDDDLAALGQQPVTAITTIVRAGLTHNGFDLSGLLEAKKDLGQTESSPSAVV